MAKGGVKPAGGIFKIGPIDDVEMSHALVTEMKAKDGDLGFVDGGHLAGNALALGQAGGKVKVGCAAVSGQPGSDGFELAGFAGEIVVMESI